MDQEKHLSYGTKIERGFVRSADAEGYIVESYDRAGLTTPPIQAIHQHQYDVGNRVYFFLFDDGRGKIIALMDD